VQLDLAGLANGDFKFSMWHKNWMADLSGGFLSIQFLVGCCRPDF
jgi:hypothetical protein